MSFLLSFLTGQVSLRCSILLRTQLLSPSFYRPDALPAAQPTVSKHWRQRPPNLHWHQHLHLNDLYWFSLTAGFEQPQQINDFITMYTRPFIPPHFLCTHLWQLPVVHCTELLPTPLTHTTHGQNQLLYLFISSVISVHLIINSVVHNCVVSVIINVWIKQTDNTQSIIRTSVKVTNNIMFMFKIFTTFTTAKLLQTGMYQLMRFQCSWSTETPWTFTANIRLNLFMSK